MTKVTKDQTCYGYAETPLGPVLLTGRDGRLRGLYFAGLGNSPKPHASWKRDDRGFEPVREQLGQYFAGCRHGFELPLELVGSSFQLSVWSALREIPYGEVTSYGAIALRIGKPGAARAVGSANGRNPVSLIVPCHRVVASDAGIGGYGWGIERKAWLLEHERRWNRGEGDSG